MPNRNALEENHHKNRRFSINDYSNYRHSPLWAQSEISSPSMRSQLPPSSSNNSSIFHSRNALFSALPEDVKARFAPHLRRILLHQNDVLYKSNSEIKHVYFIENGLISLVVDSYNGTQAEAAVIGSEGMVGALAALGATVSFHRTMVQIPGKALRLPVHIFQEECQKNSMLQEWVFAHTNLLIAQISQAVLCSRLHTVEARLHRWLLTSRDRIGSDTLELTHDHIAQMLGTRRPGITLALGTLQQAGLIECGRGTIVIKDSEKMKQGACECYCILQDQFQRFLN
jgi:CRP-like cAMP-binding protein